MTACMHAWRLFPRGPAATDGFTPGSNSNDDDKMPCEPALKKLLLQNKLLPAPIKVSFFFFPPKAIREGKQEKRREQFRVACYLAQIVAAKAVHACLLNFLACIFG